MWICSRCQSDVDDDFDLCWNCQADREEQVQQPSQKQADDFRFQNKELDTTWFAAVYGVAGALCGAVIGYLIGPTLPFGAGHLPLETVLTAGSNLQDLDAALLGSMAREAFTTLLLCTATGGIIGFGWGRLKQNRDNRVRLRQPTTKTTPLSPAAVLVTEEPSASGPACIELGQTITQVEEVLNEQPKTIVKLQDKEIYVYTDMKITFVDGRVTEVKT